MKPVLLTANTHMYGVVTKPCLWWCEHLHDNHHSIMAAHNDGSFQNFVTDRETKLKLFTDANALRNKFTRMHLLPVKA